MAKGTEVTVLAEENGFYRISCQENDDITEGYVRKEFLDVEEFFEIEEYRSNFIESYTRNALKPR